MQPIVQLRDVHKHYKRAGGEIRAVDGVSLEVFPGETLGIIGESGCGKSTLARCILGLTETTSGEVTLDGVAIARMTTRELRSRRREFQMVFQDASLSLDPLRTVRDALLEPFRAHGLGTAGEREQWLHALLDDVGLDASVLACYPAQLSGGQQQRVAIARAIALKPRLLIADEPVSALDASVAAQIIDLLAGIHKRTGVTLLVISHSLTLIRHLCDRVAVMYLGDIVEDNGAEQFFAGPLHPYGDLLLKSSPGLGSGSRPASTAPAAATEAGCSHQGCKFLRRCQQCGPRCADEQPRLSTVSRGGKVSCFFPLG